MKTNKNLKRFLIVLLFVVSLFINFSIGSSADVLALPSYYDSANLSGLTENALKKELRDLITETHTTITTYDDCKNPEIVAQTDGDPNNPGNIILFWSNLSVSSSWDGGTTWNREHVWPRSLGWFEYTGAGADLHQMRPADPVANSTHSNDPYGIVTNGTQVDCSAANNYYLTDCYNGGGTFEPGDSRKGDVARIIFYLLTRYSESDSYSVTSVATSMDMLLDWNALDPVDDSEIRRNNAVESIQGNRNPFIDDSNFANLIWDPDRSVEVTQKGKVNVAYNTSHANVVINGNKDTQNYYTGNVTINVTVNSGITYNGLKDLSTGTVLTTNTTYTINNISRDVELEVLTTEGTTEQPGEDVQIDGYYLVTDIADLSIGDNIVITDETSSFALSSQNSTYRNKVDIAAENNKLTISDGAEIITLGQGIVNNTFALKVTEGYLYACSSTNNQVKTQQTIDENASWLITIDSSGVASIVAQGTYSRNDLRYNSSSPRFSCYSSTNTQKKLCIYKEITTTSVDSVLTTFGKLQTKTSLSLSYSYSSNVLESTSEQKFTLPPIGISANKTTEVETNYASTLGLSSDYSVTFEKNGATQPALNPSDGIRLYSSSGGKTSSMIITNSNLSFTEIYINQASTNTTFVVYILQEGSSEWIRVSEISNTATNVLITYKNVHSIKVTNESSTKGFINELKLYYSEDKETNSYTMKNTGIRFGNMIEASLYEGLKELGSNVTYGIVALKKTTFDNSDLTLNDYAALEGYYFELTPVRVNANGEADENGDYYQFALVINEVPLESLQDEIIAACYVNIDGNITLMGEKVSSVKATVDQYLSSDTSGITDYVGVLTYLSEYEG